MTRYALKISYDGSDLDGWQSQPSGRGVQDALCHAANAIGERGRAIGAGRTDAGVHARAQVAHIDLEHEFEPRRLKLALNAHLPDSVAVISAARADGGFHARHSAISREYRYFIKNSSTCYPYIKKYVMHLPARDIDWTEASRAARMMEGTHDFRAFCRTCDAPDETTRTVFFSRLHRIGDMIVFRIKARGYLTNMIRIAVGNFIAAGRGRGAEWFEALLAGAPRTESAKTVPASGLFFWGAEYDKNIEWE